VHVSALPDHNIAFINWYNYLDYAQLGYDDGIADSVFAFHETGDMAAVRFTPDSYPAHVLSAEVNIYNGTWPPGDIFTPFLVALYDDDGPGGLPGTELAVTEVTPFDYGWVYADFSPDDVTIENGDFYVVRIQGGDLPDCAPIAVDLSDNDGRSYIKDISGGEDWQPFSSGDIMIRSWIENPEPPTANPGGRNLSYYSIYRLQKGDELIPDNWTLVGDHILDPFFYDITWTYAETGSYRYAVQAVYSLNVSGPAFSNILDNTLDVTIHLSTDCEDNPGGSFVTLRNDDNNPDHAYQAVSETGQALFFSNIAPGMYDLTIESEYYHFFDADSIIINNDTTLNPELFLICRTPNISFENLFNIHICFTGNPETVFSENFEGGEIPEGWTQEYADTVSLSWVVQTGSPSGVPDHAHLGWYNAAFGGLQASTMLITPEIDLSGKFNPRLIFWHTQPNDTVQDELKLYYQIFPSQDWIAFASFNDNIAGWTHEEVLLPEEDGVVRIGFLGNAHYEGLGICLDDIKIVADTVKCTSTRCLEGFNIYLDGMLLGFITELNVTLTDLVPGQFYILGIQAVYANGFSSIILQFPITYYPCDYFNQPQNFAGTVNGMDVILTWDPPPGIENVEYLIKYDNNAPDNAMEWYDAGGETAVRFTPEGYPCEIRQFHMHIWDGTWPAGDILNPFRIVIYDDDGSNGYPGTELGEKDVTPDHYYWVDFDISDLDVSIGSGDFYLAHYQLGVFPNCPSTGIDGSAAGQGRSYDHAVGMGWGPGQYDQYMIRATVFGPQLDEQVLGPETVHVDGTHTGGAVSVKPAAPIITGDIPLGKGDYVTTDDRSRFTLKGYNVYKDNVKLNDVLWTSQIYIDHCSPGGIYYYNVTAVWDMGESCFIDPSYEAIVSPQLPTPTGLTAELLEGNDVLLTWNKPGESTGLWLHWDDGTNSSAIGLMSAGSFLVASRWTTEDLLPYDGLTLTKIAFYPAGEITQYALMVWAGDNAGTLFLNQPLTNVVVDSWNTVTLDTPVPVDATQELWFGYECIDQPVGEYPAGHDAGPAVAGKGDLLSGDGGETWETLSSYGLNYNWNLQGWVTNEATAVLPAALPKNKTENTGSIVFTTGNQKIAGQTTFIDNDRFSLSGYNIWRNGDNIHFVAAPDTFYTDPAVAPGTHNYYVSAVYEEGESWWTGPAEIAVPPVGTVQGKITDAATGVPIENAIITCNPGGYADTSDVNGDYVIPDISQRTYSVTAQAAGFHPQSVDKFVSGMMHLDFALDDRSVAYLPFTETWDSASFDQQHWTFAPVSGNWFIDQQQGHPSPSAGFSWDPSIGNYAFALESPQLKMNNPYELVYFEFKLNITDNSAAWFETMTVDVWSGFHWVTLDEFTGENILQWATFNYDLTDYLQYPFFKIRFVVNGGLDQYLNTWNIDDIMVRSNQLANLKGDVTDPYNHTIEGATVTVEGFQPVVTDSTGYYEVNVYRGYYTVTAEAPEYKSCTFEDFLIKYTTNLDIILEPVVEIPSVTTQPDFLVFPNPSSSYLIVKPPDQAKSIVLLNCQGQAVWQAGCEGMSSVQINVEDYPRGLYFVQCLLDNGRVLTKKMLILR